MNEDERRRYWMALPYEVRKPWDETVVAMEQRGYSEEEKTRYIENRIKEYYGQKQGNPGRYDKYPKELYQFWNSQSVPQRKDWLKSQGMDEGYAHFTFVNLPTVVKNWVLNAWKGQSEIRNKLIATIQRNRMNAEKLGHRGVRPVSQSDLIELNNMTTAELEQTAKLTWQLTRPVVGQGNPQQYHPSEADKSRMVSELVQRTGRPFQVITGLPLEKLIELWHKLPGR